MEVLPRSLVLALVLQSTGIRFPNICTKWGRKLLFRSIWMPDRTDFQLQCCQQQDLNRGHCRHYCCLSSKMGYRTSHPDRTGWGGAPLPPSASGCPPTLADLLPPRQRTILAAPCLILCWLLPAQPQARDRASSTKEWRSYPRCPDNNFFELVPLIVAIYFA